MTKIMIGHEEALVTEEAITYLRKHYHICLSVQGILYHARQGNIKTDIKGHIRLYRPSALDQFAAVKRSPGRPKTR